MKQIVTLYFALIPIGIPTGAEKPKDKWNPKQVHWNGW